MRIRPAVFFGELRVPVFLNRILLACLATGLHCNVSQAANQPVLETGAELQARMEWQAALPEPETDDPMARCAYFHRRGWANFSLGRYDQATNDLRQALALNSLGLSPRDEWCKRWRIQDDLDKTFAAAGEYLPRVAFLHTLSDELRNENRRRYFMVQLKLAQSHLAFGMLEKAEAAFEHATAVLQELPAANDWQREQYNIRDRYYKAASELKEARGRYAEAEQSFRVALSNAEQYANLWAASGDPAFGRVVQDNKTGNILRLAANLTVQGRHGESRRLVGEALARTLALNSFHTANTSGVLSLLGNIDLRQGRLDEAARYFDLAFQALGGSAAKPYSIALARIRDRIGLIHVMQDRWDEALTVYELRDTDLRSNPGQAAMLDSGNIDWAMALIKTGRPAAAVAMLKEVLHSAQARQSANPLEMAYVQGYLGIALLEQGEHIPALRQFQGALPALLKAVDGDSAGFVAIHRQRVILDRYLELLASLYASGHAPPDLDAPNEAFAIADIARNSSVQRAITASANRAAIPDAHLAQLVRREQDAANQMRSLNTILDRLASNRVTDPLQANMKAIQREIDRLRQEQVELKKELAEKHSDYADLVSPRLVAPADIQKTLRPFEAVISIYSTPRQTLVWSVTPGAVDFRIVPIAREQLSRDVKELTRSLTFAEGKINAFDAETSHRLFSRLLGPDASEWVNGKLLNIIPHGTLGQLPFAVLLTDPVGKAQEANHAEWPWLIAKSAIAQQSSASAFLALRHAAANRREQKPFVGFGDPVFMADAQPAVQRGLRLRNLALTPLEDETLGIVEQARRGIYTARSIGERKDVPLAQVFSRLPALPDTAEELREIAVTVGADPQTDLFLGARATESNVKNTDLSHHRIVAFATHGLVPQGVSGLDQPALALSNPALVGDTNNDGLLSLDEVLGLKLDAEWVVLSACDTASADGSGAEAASGLGRAFFFAGARSLLVSNWAVETGSARLLTTGLFTQQKNNPAMARAEALRQAMLGVMNSDIEDYSHPLFWALFTLMGDGTSVY